MILIARGLKNNQLVQYPELISFFLVKELSVQEEPSEGRPQGAVWPKAKRASEKTWVVSRAVGFGKWTRQVLCWWGRAGPKKYKFGQYLQIVENIKNKTRQAFRF